MRACVNWSLPSRCRSSGSRRQGTRSSTRRWPPSEARDCSSRKSKRPCCAARLIWPGNLDTRLRKLEAGEYDGIILAAAGIKRLGWSEYVTEYLSPDVCLPAIGQGALALEGRADDGFVREVVARLDHHPTRTAVT